MRTFIRALGAMLVLSGLAACDGVSVVAVVDGGAANDLGAEAGVDVDNHFA